MTHNVYDPEIHHLIQEEIEEKITAEEQHYEYLKEEKSTILPKQNLMKGEPCSKPKKEQH